ncbi:MAG: type I-U CRISPR-associated protein Cas7 [Deltaproteobacteria bacterium]|nr:type I-U CRISPR-associated protein Cas7 [Deltaproteobacteria bacterium]
MTNPTTDQINAWATDKNGPVALHFHQELLPVEGRGEVFFPPTFAFRDAHTHYNIDTLQDGTKVCLVDSVGSQANRMEPLFLEEHLKGLVPDITVAYGDETKETDGIYSLLEAGHRLGDAIVRCTELKDDAQKAFKTFLRKGDATELAKLSPTSLVFGVWDSRDTMAKIPRILQSTIRAWDVSKLTRSAQFNPALDYAELDIFSADEKKKAEDGKSPVAGRGFGHVPAAESHGGIVAHGVIRRDVTLNLIALRRFRGPNSDALKQYVLALALLAATETTDPFLRQGCLLVPDVDAPAKWESVGRNGVRSDVNFESDALLNYAKDKANHFGVGEARHVKFDKKLAQEDLKHAKKEK